MIKFYTDQKAPQRGGTLQDMKRDLGVMVDAKLAESVVDNLNDRYGNISCEEHPGSIAMVEVAIAVVGQKKAYFEGHGEFCCEKYGQVVKELLNNISLSNK